MIIADCHEPVGMRNECDAIDDLRKKYGNGDYLIQIVDTNGTQRRFLVERKTTSDFLNTVHMDGRLNAQLEGVDALIYERSYIPKRGHEWFVSLHTALNGVTCHTPVLFTVSSKHTVHQLRIIEEKLRTDTFGKLRQSVVIPPVTSSSNESQVRCLMAFPGVGEKRANDILKRFGTLKDALCQIDKWTEVKGIGKKTVESAVSLLVKKVEW